MTTLNAQTVFTIAAPHSVYVESAQLLLLPENSGVDARRELHYPGSPPALPPIIYYDDPDDTENFDSIPLTARPMLKIEKTLEGTKTAVWPGYIGDRFVKEVWKGADKIARMKMYTLRRLIEYFMNPPSSGLIKWIPRDRGDDVGYWIRIHNLTAGGEGVRLNQNAWLGEIALYEIALLFELIGEAT